MATADEACRGDPAAAAALYRELATGAESGWDFSSRWMTEEGDLASLRTTRVLPVDLNAILCDMEANMERFAKVRPEVAAPRAPPLDVQAALGRQHFLCTSGSTWKKNSKACYAAYDKAACLLARSHDELL